MAESVFVMGSGGSIFEMDVPRDPHALELFEGNLAKGAMRVLDASTVERVDVVGGGYTWRIIAEPAPKAKGKGGRKPKPDAPADEADGETTPADEADETTGEIAGDAESDETVTDSAADDVL